MKEFSVGELLQIYFEQPFIKFVILRSCFRCVF